METLIVSALVNAPMDHVWKCWTDPQDIIRWNFASEDWHCPKAVNDLQNGGEFSYTMAAKDGSATFDFRGTYQHIAPEESIVYFTEDGRKVVVLFSTEEGGVRVTEVVEPEEINSLELQSAGWQAILENFRSYTEKK
jgi:uncharacterized protein YndB with AHSA1/START domain